LKGKKIFRKNILTQANEVNGVTVKLGFMKVVDIIVPPDNLTVVFLTFDRGGFELRDTKTLGEEIYLRYKPEVEAEDK
jgi:hypothetical protein